MKKKSTILLTAMMCAMLCSCGASAESNTVDNTVSIESNEQETNDAEIESDMLAIGDTAQGEICKVTVNSVEFVDKIENGFLTDMWSPAKKQYYQDVTAEEGYSIVKVPYNFEYTGKEKGNITLKFALDYDDGYIFEGTGGHALPVIENKTKVGFKEEYVFGSKTYFEIPDPLEFKSEDAFVYIFVNNAAKENPDKSFVLNVSVPSKINENSDTQDFTYNLR